MANLPKPAGLQRKRSLD